MVQSRKLLVVEDDFAMQELLSFNLSKSGWDITMADSGEAALLAVTELNPDLILLDYQLPGVDGLQVCRTVRNYPNTSSIPIIMLSAVVADAQIVSALETGADDFIRKPFNLDMLQARMQAVLRRSPESRPKITAGPLHIHNMRIDPICFSVRVDDQSVQLSRNDFAVLLQMAQHPGRVFTRRQIIDLGHDDGSSISERSVDVQMVGLRKKIGTAGKYIQTVRGVGYRIQEE